MEASAGEVNVVREAVSAPRSPQRARAFACALLVACVACGGGDRSAERLYREARERVAQKDYAGAVERLDAIVRDHASSPLAEQARRDAILYRGLDEAVKRSPERRARETLVQVARVLERYRAAKRELPGDLASLVPSWIDRVPDDPWGRALAYERTPRGGYRLSCLGADGKPGGTGDDADLVVEDGAFAGERR